MSAEENGTKTTKEIQNQQKIMRFDKRATMWNRFRCTPFRKSFIFVWNLLMMFQMVLPLNITSRVWGWVNALNLPLWSRVPIYRFYSWMYRCNLDEILDPNLRAYNNLSEFFRRSLKPECRPFDDKSILVSPVDGKIVSLGMVQSRKLQDVKGISYTLKGFLGPASWAEGRVQFTSMLEKKYRSMKSADRTRSSGLDQEHESFVEELKRHESSKLFHCILYLAPGDYHKFHSPTNWTVLLRRHFPGKLFSVNPLFTSWIKNLFCLNERAVYIGQWAHGFFSFTAVGANNVGSISVACDPQLRTNTPTSRLLRGAIRGWQFIKRSRPAGAEPRLQQRYYDRRFSRHGNSTVPDERAGLQIAKGELFGEFNFGSTVVLIFEAPADFQFRVELNEHVNFGQTLGGLGVAH